MSNIIINKRLIIENYEAVYLMKKLHYVAGMIMFSVIKGFVMYLRFFSRHGSQVFNHGNRGQHELFRKRCLCLS